jgi:phosphoglycerate dehydrogenase-like enzyme
VSTKRPTVALSMYAGMESYALRPEHLARLGELCEVLEPVAVEGMDRPRADEVLARAEVLLGHWGCTRLDEAQLARAPHLRMVAYAAGTVKEVVTPATFARGILVTSGAAANAVPVAEYTVAVILLANKDAFVAAARMRDPSVPAGPRRHPVGNWAKRIGIVGASHVGRRVIELLAPYHLEVVVADPFLDAAGAVALGATLVDLDELLATSDVVSLHAPALPETRHMIGAPQLASMMDGAVLVNTARGSLVDHDALTAEVAARRLTAVLDVTDPEPLPSDHPLAQRDDCIVVPHLGSATVTTRTRMAVMSAENLVAGLRGQPMPNPLKVV